MRKVLALGAAILFVGSVSVAVAQERLQSNQSGMGVGEGVGDVSGNSTRVNVFDRTSFLERLSQAETVYGRVLGVDVPGKKLYLESGGSSHDEGRAGGGAMNYRTVYFDDKTNMDQIRTLGSRRRYHSVSLRGNDRSPAVSAPAASWFVTSACCVGTRSSQDSVVWVSGRIR